MKRSLLLIAALLAVSALPPAPLPHAYAAGGQVSMRCCSTTQTPTSNATSYRGWTNGAAVWDATQDDAAALAGGTGDWTVDLLTITLKTDPNPGQLVFTLEKAAGAGAWADTGLTVTFTSGGGLIQQDLTHSATFSPGDRINWKCVSSSSPTAPGRISFAMRVTASGPNMQWWTFSSSNSHNESGTQTYYVHPDGAGISVANTETGIATFADPIASGGTVSALYVQSEVDPGNTNTLVVTLRKASAGGALSMADTALTCTITGNGTTSKTANDTTHSVSVVAGDLLDFRITGVSVAAGVRARIGVLFAPTVNGNMVINHNVTMTQNSTGQYDGWYQGFSATEDTRIEYAAVAGTLKNLYCDTSGNSASAPASGQTITWTAQSGAASPLTPSGVTAAITGDGNTTKTVNDLTHSLSVTVGQFLDMKAVTTATTGNVAAGFSFVYNIAQGGVIDGNTLPLRFSRRPVPLFASGRVN